MSFRRFVVSTRPLQEAIIRVHCMKCLPDSMHLYMAYLFIICSVLTEKGSFEELPTVRHTIEFELNRVNERFNVSESGTGYLVTHRDRVLYILLNA